MSPILFVAKEVHDREKRVAVVPAGVGTLAELSFEVWAEKGCGMAAGFSTEAYARAGAVIVESAEEALPRADVVLRVRAPQTEDLGRLKPGSLQVGLMNPFRGDGWGKRLAESKVAAISLELIPRTTIAQTMDVMSSQASLAGYAGVLLGARKLGCVLPMMMTPAGTLRPARVFILGAGVAGLQAIATAKRLGARVEAFDPRPGVEEQVRSLGGQFFHLDLGEVREAGGYVGELTGEQLREQREGLLKALRASDLIITTARVFGRPSPCLITAAMLEQLRPGTVVVDLAVGSGGNVEGSEPGKTTVTSNGVMLIGNDPMECEVARGASLLFSSNLNNFLRHIRSGEGAERSWKWDDPILRDCLLTRDGKVVNARLNGK
jgi:H+-translocating NAD(P) transhydrogenase subunit alpha